MVRVEKKYVSVLTTGFGLQYTDISQRSAKKITKKDSKHCEKLHKYKHKMPDTQDFIIHSLTFIT